VALVAALLLASLAGGCGADGAPADAGVAAPSDLNAPDAAGDAPAPADAALPEDATAPWRWPACPALADAGRLVDKARALDDLVRRQHLGDGLIRTVTLDAEGAVVARHHLPSSGLWTAMYLASQSLRFAVTGEAEAAENARSAALGLHDLTAVTGTPGLYGRAFRRPDAVYAHEAAGAPGWVESTAPGYEGWWWDDDVSKDTMDGIVFGYAVALDHLTDPDTRALVRDDLLAFVRRFVADGLQIVDHHGGVTEHGRVFASALDDFPGFNALLAAAWIRTAIAAGADELRPFYEDCLMRRGGGTDCPPIELADLGPYVHVIETLLQVYRPSCKTSFDNIDMVFHAIYPLLRREEIPELAARLRAVLDVGIWQPPDPDVAPPVHRSTHSLYIFLYGALADPAPDDPVFRAAMEDAVCTLAALPADRHDRTVHPVGPEAVCTNRMGRPNAAAPLPLADRHYDNYLWRLDPYEIDSHEAVPGLVHSPEDFLLAYWLGRYHGLLSAER
jgi:hypothetical protein